MIYLNKLIKKLNRDLFNRWVLIRWLKGVLQRPLNSFLRNDFSQNGEDGVLEELFRRLGICQGVLVEFGAWDGIHCSNTFRLISRNNKFKAFYIEGDAEHFQLLLKTKAKYPDKIVAISAFVQPQGSDSLDNILKHSAVPTDIDLLSIDVDSTDYQIWEGLVDYSPKIVVVEINSNIDPRIPYVHGQGTEPGSSFSSMLQLGTRKGYVCVCHTGNMIFVRKDLCPSSLQSKDSYKLFDTTYLKKSG
jgi:hypothetical protein